MATSNESRSDKAQLRQDPTRDNIDAEPSKPEPDESGPGPSLQQFIEEALECFDVGDADRTWQDDISIIHKSPGEEHGTTRGSEDRSQVDPSDPPSVEEESGQIQAVSVKYAMEQGYPDLNFRFTTLKTWFLIMTVVLWLSIITIVVVLIYVQQSSPGVLHVRVEGSYYSVRYASVLVGMLTTIWWRSICQSYRRIYPYIIMANRPTLDREGVEVAAETLVNMDMEMIDLGELAQVIKGRYWTALAVNVLSFCIPSLLVAVKSAFIQITEDQGGWGITVDTRIGYIIIVLYSALCASSIAVLVELRGKHTGLKWSPCSLAAQLALVHSSNIFPAFEGMELCTRGMVRGRTRNWWRTYGYLRIGYWRKTHVEGNAGSELLFHGIRFVCTDRLHARAESVRVNARYRNDRAGVLPLRAYSPATNLYAESEAPVALLTDRHASHLDGVWHKPLGFHRYPWSGRGPAILWFWSGGTVFLSDIYIAVMMLLTFLSLVGLATFLATGIILKPKSYANSSVLGSQGTRNVILNSSPAFLLSLVNIVFVMSDTYHRTLQPVRGMDQPSTAQQSLLVDYLSPAPFNVIIAATSNGHYRVAWCSFLALIASTGPAIAGGMFTVDSASKTFRATPSSAYLVLGVLCAYVIAIPMARPSAKYAAGRGLWNIIDTVSFCYDSPILEHPEFSVQGKSDEEIHLKSQVIAARRHYQFGYYLGLSGRRRLGFAEAKTEPHSSTGPNSSVGQGTNVIVHGVDRVKSRYGFLRFNVSWFRDPEVIRSDQSSDIEMDVGNISQSGERNNDADGSGI